MKNINPDRVAATRDKLVDEYVALMSAEAGDPGPTGQFAFRGDAEIESLNTRKVGPEESRELAVDVKLAIKAHAATLLQFADATMLAALFLPGGAVRSLKVGPITFTNELEHYRIDVVGSSFYGVKLKKFTITPRDGYQLAIGFQASFSPSADEIARLAEYLSDEVEIAIEPESDGLDLRRAA